MLLRVLQQQQEQQRKPSSKDKKKVVGEREEEEEEEEDIMDNEDLTLTEMPLSNADFLSLASCQISFKFVDLLKVTYFVSFAGGGSEFWSVRRLFRLRLHRGRPGIAALGAAVPEPAATATSAAATTAEPE